MFRDNVQVLKRQMIVGWFCQNEAHRYAIDQNEPAERRIERRQKTISRPPGIEAADALQTFPHCLNAYLYQRLGIAVRRTCECHLHLSVLIKGTWIDGVPI